MLFVVIRIMSIFHDWTPREKDALNRALQSMKPKHFEPPVKLSIYDGVRWGYDRQAWVVYALIDGKRTECGTTRDEHKAPDLQQEAELAHLNRIK